MELRNGVAAQLGVELPATVTFDYPTPAALAAYVHSQLLPATTGAAATPEAASPIGQGGWEASTPQGGRRGRLRPRADSSRLAAASGRSRAAGVLQKLTEVAAGVLGAPPPADQPLMEVCGLVARLARLATMPCLLMYCSRCCVPSRPPS